jgi:hypothetical protein
MLAPGKRWHQESAGVREMLAPEKGWYQERSTRWEGIEEQDWNRDSLPRPDTEGQVTGTTAKSHNCHPSAQLQVILRFKDETIKAALQPIRFLF